MCVESALCVSSNAGEDLVCGSGPDEGRGILVVDHDIFANGGFQLFYAAKYAAANPFVGEFGKPPFLGALGLMLALIGLAGAVS